MPFSTSLPGLREATLDALKALAVAKISDLNAALTRDASTPIGTITSSMFKIGDPDKMPALAAAPMLFCFVGGGKRDGTDMEIGQEFIDDAPTRGKHHTVYTNIYLYLHPQALPDTDAFSQAETRERTMARCVDWIRSDVFNTSANLVVTLGSREYSVAPNFDQLIEAKITEISIGYFQKNFGGSQWVFSAHLVHRGRMV